MCNQCDRPDDAVCRPAACAIPQSKPIQYTHASTYSNIHIHTHGHAYMCACPCVWISNKRRPRSIDDCPTRSTCSDMHTCDIRSVAHAKQMESDLTQSHQPSCQHRRRCTARAPGCVRTNWVSCVTEHHEFIDVSPVHSQRMGIPSHRISFSLMAQVAFNLSHVTSSSKLVGTDPCAASH